MYNYITCPNTGKTFPINHEDGLNIINNYLQVGGNRMWKTSVGKLWSKIKQIPIGDPVLGVIFGRDENGKQPEVDWAKRSPSDVEKLLSAQMEGMDGAQKKFFLDTRIEAAEKAIPATESVAAFLRDSPPLQPLTPVSSNELQDDLERIIKYLINNNFSYNNWKLLKILANLHQTMDERQPSEATKHFDELVYYIVFLKNLGKDTKLVTPFTFRFKNLISPVYKNYIEDVNIVKSKLRDLTTASVVVKAPSVEDAVVEVSPQARTSATKSVFAQAPSLLVTGVSPPMLSPSPPLSPPVVARGGGVQKGGTYGLDINNSREPLLMCMLTDALHAGKIEPQHDFAPPLRTEKSSDHNISLHLAGNPKFKKISKLLSDKNTTYFKMPPNTNTTDSNGWNHLICGKKPDSEFKILCKNLPPLLDTPYNLSKLYDTAYMKYSDNKTQLNLNKDKKNYLKNFLSRTSIMEPRCFNLFSLSPLFLEEIAVNNYSPDDLRTFYATKLTFTGTTAPNIVGLIVTQLNAFLTKAMILQDSPLLKAAIRLKNMKKKGSSKGAGKLLRAAQGLINKHLKNISQEPNKISKVAVEKIRRSERQLKYEKPAKIAHDFFTNVGITGYTIDGNPAGGSDHEREFFVGIISNFKNLLTQYTTAAASWDPRSTNIKNMTGDFRPGIIPYDSFASFTRRRLAVTMEPSGNIKKFHDQVVGTRSQPVPRTSQFTKKNLIKGGKVIDLRFNLFYNIQGQDWQNIVDTGDGASQSFIPMEYYPNGRDSIILPKKYVPPWKTDGDWEQFDFIGFIYGLPGVDWLKIIDYICATYIANVQLEKLNTFGSGDTKWGNIYNIWKQLRQDDKIRQQPRTKKEYKKLSLNRKEIFNGLWNGTLKALTYRTESIYLLFDRMHNVLEIPKQQKNRQNIETIIKFISRVIDDGLTAARDESKRIEFIDYITKILHDLKCSGDRGFVKCNRYLYFKDGLRLLHMANDVSAMISSTFNCRGSVAAAKFYTLEDVNSTTNGTAPPPADSRIMTVMSRIFKQFNKSKFTQKTFSAGFFATYNSHDIPTDVNMDTNNKGYNEDLYKQIRLNKRLIGKEQLIKLAYTGGLLDGTTDINTDVAGFMKGLASNDLEKWLLGTNWNDEVEYIVDKLFTEEADMGPEVALPLPTTHTPVVSPAPLSYAERTNNNNLQLQQQPRVSTIGDQQGGRGQIGGTDTLSVSLPGHTARIRGAPEDYNSIAKQSGLLSKQLWYESAENVIDVAPAFAPAPTSADASAPATRWDQHVAIWRATHRDERQKNQMDTLEIEVKNSLVQIENINNLLLQMTEIDAIVESQGPVICKECLKQKLNLINIPLPEGPMSAVSGLTPHPSSHPVKCVFCSTSDMREDFHEEDITRSAGQLERDCWVLSGSAYEEVPQKWERTIQVNQELVDGGDQWNWPKVDGGGERAVQTVDANTYEIKSGSETPADTEVITFKIEADGSSTDPQLLNLITTLPSGQLPPSAKLTYTGEQDSKFDEDEWIWLGLGLLNRGSPCGEIAGALGDEGDDDGAATKASAYDDGGEDSDWSSEDDGGDKESADSAGESVFTLGTEFSTYIIGEWLKNNDPGHGSPEVEITTIPEEAAATEAAAIAVAEAAAGDARDNWKTVFDETVGKISVGAAEKGDHTTRKNWDAAFDHYGPTMKAVGAISTAPIFFSNIEKKTIKSLKKYLGRVVVTKKLTVALQNYGKAMREFGAAASNRQDPLPALPQHFMLTDEYIKMYKEKIHEQYNVMITAHMKEVSTFMGTLRLVYNLYIFTSLLIECNEIAVKIFTLLSQFEEERNLPIDQAMEFSVKNKLISTRVEAWCDQHLGTTPKQYVPLFINTNWWQSTDQKSGNTIDLCLKCHAAIPKTPIDTLESFKYIKDINDIGKGSLHQDKIKKKYLYTLKDLKIFKYVSTFMSTLDKLETFIDEKLRLLSFGEDYVTYPNTPQPFGTAWLSADDGDRVYTPIENFLKESFNMPIEPTYNILKGEVFNKHSEVRTALIKLKDNIVKVRTTTSRSGYFPLNDLDLRYLRPNEIAWDQINWMSKEGRYTVAPHYLFVKNIMNVVKSNIDTNILFPHDDRGVGACNATTTSEPPTSRRSAVDEDYLSLRILQIFLCGIGDEEPHPCPILFINPNMFMDYSEYEQNLLFLLAAQVVSDQSGTDCSLFDYEIYIQNELIKLDKDFIDLSDKLIFRLEYGGTVGEMSDIWFGQFLNLDRRPPIGDEHDSPPQIYKLIYLIRLLSEQHMIPVLPYPIDDSSDMGSEEDSEVEESPPPPQVEGSLYLAGVAAAAEAGETPASETSSWFPWWPFG